MEKKLNNDLLAWALREFAVELNEPGLDDSNFPPELPAILDPSTNEYLKQITAVIVNFNGVFGIGVQIPAKLPHLTK